MVRGTSATTNIANIEQMNISGDSDGQGNIFGSILYFDELTPSEQTTYTNAVNLFALDGTTYVLNTNAELDVTRITSQVVDPELEQTLDFATMSPAEQQTLRDFLALAVSKSPTV
jgi:hypothetical protein